MPTLEIMEATMSGLVAVKFPGVTTLAIFLVVSIFFLALIRTAFNRLVSISHVAASNADSDEKDTLTSVEPSQNRTHFGAISGWSWRWEGLPLSLPVSLTTGEKDCPRAGVGMGVVATLQQQQQQQQMQQQPSPTQMIWHARQRGPGFESPLPALYDTPVPISMAKIIMSRHTYRRPNPQRGSSRPKVSRSRSAPPPHPRPLHSMV